MCAFWQIHSRWDQNTRRRCLPPGRKAPQHNLNCPGKRYQSLVSSPRSMINSEVQLGTRPLEAIAESNSAIRRPIMTSSRQYPQRIDLQPRDRPKSCFFSVLLSGNHNAHTRSYPDRRAEPIPYPGNLFLREPDCSSTVSHLIRRSAARRDQNLALDPIASLLRLGEPQQKATAFIPSISSKIVVPLLEPRLPWPIQPRKSLSRSEPAVTSKKCWRKAYAPISL